MAGIDYYTKLLLHMDGDQSDSNHSVVHNGSPKYNNYYTALGNGSLYFNGTSSYLSIADSDDWDFGTGDFTIDFWVNLNSHSSTINFLSHAVDVNNRFSFSWSYSQGCLFSQLIVSGISLLLLGDSWTPENNTWYHIAFVRESGVLYFYVNGIQKGSDDFTNNINLNGILRIGCGMNGSGSLDFNVNGYIDEFRISKGIARWTEDFTPPAAVYTKDSYTKLLLHMEGGIAGNDATYNAVAEGTPTLNASTAVFDGSMYFDGTGDYLRFDDHANWNFGAGDFTVDFNVNFTSTADYPQIVSKWDGGGSNLKGWAVYYNNSNHTLVFEYSTNGSTGTSLAVSWTPTTATWYHVAVVREGTDVKLYIDGTQQGSTQTIGTATIASPVTHLRIGTAFVNGASSATSEFNGYLDEFRITKGLARWTANFTPSTTAYSLEDNVEDDEYTKLLLHMDGDKSWSYHTVTHNGAPKYDTSNYVFGNGSIYFNGTSDYLTIPDHNDWDFGTGDFTIDFRARPSSVSGLVIFIGASDQTEQIGFNNSGAGSNKFYIYNQPTNYVATVTSTISTDTWYHIAFVRKSGVLYFYLNGVLQGTGVSMTTAFNLNSFNIASLGSNYYNGYLDEFRISKGIARWTSGFTPLTESYTTDAYTKLLLHMEGDSGDTGHDVIVNTSQLNSTIKVFDGSMYFNGSTHLSIPNSVDWDWEASDFTVDTHVRFNSPSGYQTIFMLWNDWDNFAHLYFDNTNGLYFYAENANTRFVEFYQGDTSGWSADTFYHIALVRDGTTFKIYRDGVELASQTSVSASFPNFTDALHIARNADSAQNFFSGYLDEFRISKGIARWTEDFTPPGTPYGRDLTPPVTYVTGIKGTLSETSRIIIFKETDWSIEYNAVISGSGPYEIQPLVSGTKTMVARREADGQSQGYGLVETTEWVV